MTFTAGTAISSQLPPSTALPRTLNSALVLQSGDALRAMIAEVHGCEQYAPADFEASYILADFDDFARDIAAEDVGQFHPRQAFAHPDVEMVHGAGFHAHDDLIFARLRIRDVFVAKHSGPAKFVNADGFHEGSPFSLLDRRKAKSTTIRFPIRKSAAQIVTHVTDIFWIPL